MLWGIGFEARCRKILQEIMKRMREKDKTCKKKKKENCPLKDSVWRGTFDLRRNYRCSWCGKSVFFFGFRLLILIELRKVSGEDKDGVWGVNRSFRITWAHNRCCVCVCVADNEIRAPPPPLRVSILFSPIRPPFISSSLFFSSPVASGIFLSSLTSYFAK